MESANSSGPHDLRALVVVTSTEEASATFGRTFRHVRIVPHELAEAPIPEEYDVVAIGSADPEAFRRSIGRLVSAFGEVRVPELLLDLGRPADLDPEAAADVVASAKGYGVGAVEALGGGRLGVRLVPSSEEPRVDRRWLLLVAQAASLPTEDADAPARASTQRLPALEARVRRQRERIVRLEERLSNARSRALATEGGTAPAPAGSLPRRAGRMYLRLLTRLVPSLPRRSKGLRLFVAFVSAVLGIGIGLVLPILVLLLGDGVGDALLVLLVEAVGAAVLLDLVLTRRLGRGTHDATRAADEVRRVGTTSREVARSVRALDQRGRRQAQRNAAALRQIRNKVTKLAARQGKDLGALEARLQVAHDEQLKQVQALVNLFSLLQIRGALPPLGGWAASPDLALLLVEEVTQRRPRTIVECGSGSSTLLMALTIAQLDLPTRIISLEHDEEFARATRDLLERHGVGRYADVRHAPLVPTSLSDHRAPWYDEEALRDVSDVGLLFVDGPPRSTGSLARVPAVPLLRDRLAEECTIILDDADRPDEQAVAARWMDLLPDFASTAVELQKGAVVLRRG